MLAGVTSSSRAGASRPDAPSAAAGRPAAVEAVRALARAARILERAAGDLGMPQYRVLSAIAAGEERASRVAERLELGRPAVSAAVDALCRDGLVERIESAGDQRAFDLTVTPEGWSRLDQVEDDMLQVLSDLCERAKARRRAAPGGGPPAPSRALSLGDIASLGPAIDELLAERQAQRQAQRRTAAT